MNLGLAKLLGRLPTEQELDERLAKRDEFSRKMQAQRIANQQELDPSVLREPELQAIKAIQLEKNIRPVVQGERSLVTPGQMEQVDPKDIDDNNRFKKVMGLLGR